MQQEIEEFKILYCRNVPPGEVLNKETEKDYPLIECGSWISDNRHWMIQKSFRPKEVESQELYQLIPNSKQGTYAFFQHYASVIGNLSYILIIKKELDVYILRSGW